MSSLPCDLHGKTIVVAGHRGMVGAALIRRLASEHCTILGLGRESADLRCQEAVGNWFEANRPQVVFLAAAKVGGIGANSAYPADFLYDNLMIQSNIIEASRQTGVEKLVFLGSSCIYPKLAPQPIAEEALLSGPLEPTNEWYAIAKIAGIKLCQAYRKQHGCDFISAQPTNLYGPGDNFDLNASHVVPALIRKAQEAVDAGETKLVVWGSGTPLREFLHVDDLADALVFLAKTYSNDLPINVGSGDEITIGELAAKIAEVVGFRGLIEFDPTKPDGTPRKLLEVTRIKELGWSRAIGLEQGLRDTVHWYRNQRERSPRVPSSLGPE